jgi:2-isopropylmalate synthase
VALGDGPVNALDAAMRKALLPFYPALKEMHLSDFKVRVLDQKSGTAAKVRVFVESRDEHRSWTTVGISENIIEASWIALVDSIEYKLLKK